MDFAAAFESGLSYREFLDRYASPSDRRRWDDVHARVELTGPQRELLSSFRREMKVLCLAGAWCGDCVNQCPVLDHFAAVCPKVALRFLDRDENPEAAAQLRICGGSRVPVVVFLNEDGQFCGLYGDRTLSQYRKLAGELDGAACTSGLAPPADWLRSVVQDWLGEFERIQWMLRTSPRLRQKHAD
ncbi:MAG: thioredoxin family protein [Planctomycetia bacterium]|nr:thioredoxin family protein [Planctomycetia bacterium]